MAILDLNTYKAYKSINSDAKDTEHTMIISAVNAFIEAYTGRVFTTYYDVDKTEYFDATDEELYVDEHPIKLITSLKYSSDKGATYGTTLIEFTDYIVNKDGTAVLALESSFVELAYPVNGLEVTYKGGYSAVPKDLEQAAVHLTEYMAAEDYTPRKSLAGASIDNVIQPDMTARLPAHIRRVLENYRNIIF